MSARLVFLTGPKQTTTFEIDRAVIRIGRAAENDLVFHATDERRASAEHAVIERREGSHTGEPDRYVLRDRGSTNGTFLNGKRIHEAVLRPGDEIEFGPGGPRLRFELGSVPVTELAPAGGSETEPLWSDEAGMRPADRAAESSRDGTERRTSPVVPEWLQGTGGTVLDVYGRARDEGGSRTEILIRTLKGVHAINKRRVRRAVGATAVVSVALVVGVAALDRARAAELERQAAELAASNATLADELQDARTALMQVVDSLEARASALTAQIGNLEAELRRTESARSAERQTLQAQLAELRAERDQLERFRTYAARYRSSVAFLVVELIAVHPKSGARVPVASGFGTGFFVDAAGNLLTNKHVVRWDLYDEIAACRLHYATSNGYRVIPVHAVYPGGTAFRTDTGERLDLDLALTSVEGDVELVGTAPDRFDRSGRTACAVQVVEAGGEVRTLQHEAPVRMHARDNGDLALLRVRRAVRPIPLASALPEAGDPLMAFGFPAGPGPLEGLTAEPMLRTGKVLRVMETLQVDVPIYKGNSGGPLLNASGEVVGVVTRGFGESFSTALRIDRALALLEDNGVRVRTRP